ncbi:MAG: cyclic nucleotide-binding domain-containing protein [Magnetococcales bacterium]|nr:cyclic nucleotide-binding domain-containing protein [Magnetococcales bacterium]
MKRKRDVFLTLLQRHYQPFNKLSVSALYRAADFMRTFQLHGDERLEIRGGENPDYFYLLAGSATITKEQRTERLNAEEQKGKMFFLPANGAPMGITAHEESTVCHVSSDAMYELVAWDHLARDAGLFRNADEEASLKSIRESKTFRSLPLEAVFEALKRMSRVEKASGEDIVVQGARGDSFFLILHGRAEVWRQGLYDDEQKLVAVLNGGDTFGEEALILQGTRNATVRTTMPTTLLTLSVTDFEELVATPLIRSVDPVTANTLLQNGHQLVDVRYDEEYEENFIPSAQLIPLPEIRERLSELDPTQHYLVICAAGKRASVAALLMKQRKFENVAVVEGGLRDWPFETESAYL